MATQDYIVLSDEETLTAFTPVDPQQKEIEDKINSHPLTLSLRTNPAYTESRPSLKINASYRSYSLTSGVLAGPGRIVTPPYAWSEENGKSYVSIQYLGEDLCGHPGIIHGGLLATLLDEGLARCCFPALPNKIAMTANLTVNYRAPSPAGNYFVLRAKTVKVEGRKAWVEGQIETLPEEGKKPVILVEASALMIEPKHAKVKLALLNHLSFHFGLGLLTNLTASDEHCSHKIRDNDNVKHQTSTGTSIRFLFVLEGVNRYLSIASLAVFLLCFAP